MTQLRLIVFDLDGTLVDSRRDLAESANAVLAECGCPPHAEEAIGRMVGDGAATLVARAFAASNCPQPADALERFLTVYTSRLLRFTRPYPGVLDVLAQLESRVAMAVLTNKPRAATDAILEGLGLARFFGACVVGGDGPLPRKPDAAGLVHLMSEAGVAPSETLLVGDSPVDMRTARAAGVPVCLARYGFGYLGFGVEKLGPIDWAIDQPADLLRVL